MLRRTLGLSAVWLSFASTVLFILNPSPARAQLTPIAHPSAFNNHPQLLVTFFGLAQQFVPEQNGVKFTHNGQPARLGFDCLPHPYGPTRCLQAGTASDEAIFNFGPEGSPLEIQLPFLTTRAAFEVAFHVHGLNQSTVVTFLRGDTVVGTANTPTWSDTGRYKWFFVGWESTEPFDHIRLTPPWVLIALDNLRVDASARFTLVNASSGFGGYAGLELPQFPVTSFGDLGLHQVVPPQGDRSLNGCCGGTQGFVYNNFPGLAERPIAITFPRPVTRVGLTLGGFGGDQPGNAFLVTLMRGTEIVGSLAVPQQGLGDAPLFNAPFWAIEGPKFTKILLQHMQDRINIDDVSWAYAPPEPSCGDGAVIAGEQCDDGNNADGDGCSSICKVDNVPGVNQAPVAACTPDQILNVAPTFCGASFSVNAGSFDPDGDPLNLVELPTFLPLDMSNGVSRTEAFLGVTDPSGARSSCYAVVHLFDRRPPSVSCPTQVLECGSGGGANVTAASVQSQVFAHDSCQMRTMSCGPSSVFYLPGTNKTEFGEKINCTAVDWMSNAASCSPTITVRDTLPPAVTCERAPQNGNFYTVSAMDQCTGVAQLTLGGIPVNVGETIMVTRGGGTDVRVVGPESGKMPRHFIVGRHAPFQIEATDGTNKATAVCPPIR
jgi:cysteine-rich repeat protein